MQIDISKALAKIGADKPGNFKLYAAGSRLRLFVKAEALPTQPTIELTADLPGEAEEMIAQALNFLTKRSGNETPQPA